MAAVFMAIDWVTTLQRFPCLEVLSRWCVAISSKPNSRFYVPASLCAVLVSFIIIVVSNIRMRHISVFFVANWAEFLSVNQIAPEVLLCEMYLCNLRVTIY